MHTTRSTGSSTSRRPWLRRIVGVAGLAVALTLSQAGTAAAAPELAATVGTTGLSGWIQNNLISIGLLVAGAVITFRAKSKDWNGALVTGGIAILGLAVAAMGTGSTAMEVGKWLVGLVVTA
ncbi:hypothetical protein ACH41E_33420 [Streptomyces sp. NPDC020412]|uniref:hypothetical protein n=1 Tax=Streptomyces sp. NPDC020412 TaxID=3365073 RepID=UPI003798BAC3